MAQDERVVKTSNEFVVLITHDSFQIVSLCSSTYINALCLGVYPGIDGLNNLYVRTIRVMSRFAIPCLMTAEIKHGKKESHYIAS